MRLAVLLLALLLAVPGRAFPPALSPFRAEPLANAPASLAAYDGKILVVAFWASWCGSCRRAIPAYIELVDEFREKGVQLIAVSVDAEKADAVEHQEREQYAVPVYWDTQGLKEKLLLEGVPTLVVFRHDRQVLHLGGHDAKREAKLRKLLGKWTAAK